MIINDYWKVLDVEKKSKWLCNKGIIDAHLSGNFDYPWRRQIIEYWVTVKADFENFERVFILEETNYKELFL